MRNVRLPTSISFIIFVVATSLVTSFLLSMHLFNSAKAASPQNVESTGLNIEKEVGFNIEKEVERLIGNNNPHPAPIDPRNMKFPVDVRYTGQGGDGQYYDLHTWIVTDKATGARVLVVDGGVGGVACVNLPTIK